MGQGHRPRQHPTCLSCLQCGPRQGSTRGGASRSDENVVLGARDRQNNVCDVNLVLLSPRVERSPPSDRATTPGPLCPTAGAGHPTRSQARPLGGHTGSSPRGAHRPHPYPYPPRARAPSGVYVHVLDSLVLPLPSVPRATPCGPRRAELEPYRSTPVLHPHVAAQSPYIPARQMKPGDVGCSRLHLLSAMRWEPRVLQDHLHDSPRL